MFHVKHKSYYFKDYLGEAYVSRETIYSVIVQELFLINFSI